jgi:hypothetical protein
MCSRQHQSLDNIWNDAELVQKEFLRRLAMVRQSTSRAAVLAEFGRFPLRLHWLKLSVAYFNRLASMADNRVLKRAFIVSCSLVASSKPSWAGQLFKWLNNVRGTYDIPPGGLCIPEVVGQAQQRYLALIQADTGTKLKAYCRLKNFDTYAIEPYQSGRLTASIRRSMCQFRTGAHHLAIETGRWTGIERHARLCQCSTECSNRGLVEDEHHVLFDCPIYYEIRGRYWEYAYASGPTTVEDFFCGYNRRPSENSQNDR